MSQIDRAAGFATCEMLTSAGTSLVGAGVWSLWASGTGLVPLGLGTLSLLGAGFACQDTPVDGTTGGVGLDGCAEAENGWGNLFRTNEGVPANVPGGSFQIVKLLGVTRREYQWNGQWTTWVDATYRENNDPNNIKPITLIDQFGTTEADKQRSKDASYRLEIQEGTCKAPASPDTGPPADVPDTTYNDTETGCTLIVKHEGFAQNTEGEPAGPVWRIESAPAQEGTRASGGVVGGCNFAPTIYYGGPGGGGGGQPPTYLPVPSPEPPRGPNGEPWWLDPLKAAIAGAAGGIAAEIVEELNKRKFPAGSREIYAACENKEDGSPETFTVNWPEEGFEDRVLTALDAQVDFMQQFFLWKTPICKDTPTPQTGDAVTINWISDQRSLASGDFLRKLFTYFDHNNSTLEATVAHWRDFTWQAGPVIVSCVGTQLGKPQVWAESEEEAKRVINHAAAIAGVDISGAEWLVAAPKSSRYGQPGLMRVQRGVGGVLGITKRVGPSGFPEGLT